jgi:hypothetical protein
MHKKQEVHGIKSFEKRQINWRKKKRKTTLGKQSSLYYSKEPDKQEITTLS